MHCGSSLYKRPVEKVSVVGNEYMWLNVENMIEESLKKTALVRFIVDDKGAFKLWFRSVLEILNIVTDNISIMLIHDRFKN